MPWLGTVTVVGLVVLAILLWLFFRTRTQDLLTEMLEKRRATSRLVTHGEYVEALHHMPVVVALTDTTLFYENVDMQSSFELPMVDEVEYDDELATGRSVDDSKRVLRLRAHGTTFEFILTKADAAKWEAALPARRSGAQPAARVG